MVQNDKNPIGPIEIAMLTVMTLAMLALIVFF
jgi:hypothetical protein